MKLTEFKKAIENHSTNQLQTLLAELYKNLPKGVREALAIPDLITDPIAYTQKAGVKKLTQELTLTPALEDEIREFTENLQAGYYGFPNRTIHKKERPQWRFKAKNYYKLLRAIALKEENRTAVVGQLLEGLYRTFCYGCQRHIVSSEDPFASTGISQPEFFNQVLMVKAQVLESKEFIEFGIELILSQNTYRSVFSEYLIDAFVSYLKIPDRKELAIQACQKKVTQEKQRILPKKGFIWPNPETIQRQRINGLTEIYFACCASLHEFDRGIEFYQAHYDSEFKLGKEWNLDHLLRMLERLGQKDLWLREYAFAQKSGVKPRESSLQVYRFIQEQGHFPKG